MTKQYFKEKLELYEDSALKHMSEDMIQSYESQPKLFAEMLIRLLFFERLHGEEDRIIHNKIIEILYDMGIFMEGKELDIAEALIRFAEIPKEFKEEDDI